MDKLLTSLRAIEAFDSSFDEGEEFILNNLDDSHLLQKLICEAVGFADEFLVTDGGQCAWENHAALKAEGYDVFPGERDRFGWLTGCIQTKKGILIFG